MVSESELSFIMSDVKIREVAHKKNIKFVFFLLLLFFIVLSFFFVQFFDGKGISSKIEIKNQTKEKQENTTEENQNASLKVFSPQPAQKITSPITIQGEARGLWFFEATFPVEIRDSAGSVLGYGVAHADTDWMTDNFVAFTAVIAFKETNETSGEIIFQNDNPSGDPARAVFYKIPVSF